MVDLFNDVFCGVLYIKELDGSFNEDYCKWCYHNGEFVYQTKESLLDYLVEHMPNLDKTPAAERRSQFDQCLAGLKHWWK